MEISHALERAIHHAEGDVENSIKRLSLLKMKSDSSAIQRAKEIELGINFAIAMYNSLEEKDHIYPPSIIITSISKHNIDIDISISMFNVGLSDLHNFAIMIHQTTNIYWTISKPIWKGQNHMIGTRETINNDRICVNIFANRQDCTKTITTKTVEVEEWVCS